jgi:hypothetical protein
VITTLLIVHSLLAVALLGAVTHQALSVCWPMRARAKTFFGSFRAVPAGSYTTAIIVLFLVTAFVGGVLLYPSYRVSVRIVLENLRLRAANGSFELKEHFVTIGLGLLPVYWYFWRQPLGERYRRTRAILTAILAFIVWWSFIVGHVLNNIRGFGS